VVRKGQAKGRLGSRGEIDMNSLGLITSDSTYGEGFQYNPIGHDIKEESALF
jgi:hypothetical protein